MSAFEILHLYYTTVKGLEPFMEVLEEAGLTEGNEKYEEYLIYRNGWEASKSEFQALIGVEYDGR